MKPFAVPSSRFAVGTLWFADTFACRKTENREQGTENL